MRRVEVYKNIRTGKYSVRDLKTGKVVIRDNRILLKNATFAVQPAGREKVRKEGKKNVHAFVRGELFESGEWTSLSAREIRKFNKQVHYNPYLVDNFMLGNEEIFSAPSVLLNSEGVFVQ